MCWAEFMGSKLVRGSAGGMWFPARCGQGDFTVLSLFREMTTGIVAQTCKGLQGPHRMIGVVEAQKGRVSVMIETMLFNVLRSQGWDVYILTPSAYSRVLHSRGFFVNCGTPAKRAQRKLTVFRYLLGLPQIDFMGILKRNRVFRMPTSYRSDNQAFDLADAMFFVFYYIVIHIKVPKGAPHMRFLQSMAQDVLPPLTPHFY